MNKLYVSSFQFYSKWIPNIRYNKTKTISDNTGQSLMAKNFLISNAQSDEIIKWGNSFFLERSVPINALD